MKLLTISFLLIGMVALSVPVSADEQAWGESSRPSINQKLSDYKEMSRQNALEWQRKHVKQNWAQKLNGTYSSERVGETPQQNSANQFMRRPASGQSRLAAPTLISPRGGGEYKPFGQGLNTNHFQPKQSKLGLNLGTSAGSSLHVDKQNLRKEAQSFGLGEGFGTGQGSGKGTAPGSGTGFGGGPGFSQNYGQEVDPTQ